MLAAGGGVLAGCEDTTTAIGACDTGGGTARSSSRRSRSGRSACRSPAPTTRSPGRCSTTTAIRSGLGGEGGTLRLYNYADYINPALLKKFEKAYNCKIQLATYNSADEAYAKLSAGSVNFDVVLGLSGSTS